MNNFNYELQPGRELRPFKFEKDYEPIISIVMPFYNEKEHIEQTVNSVLNQTFPAWELIIVDDGSNDEDALKGLEKIAKKDKRIHVYHKENSGPGDTRDFAVSKSSESAKYICTLDSDDLIDKTYLEIAYFTLETNPNATWAYTDSIGFGKENYTWNKGFSSNKLKKVNELTVNAVIKKEDFLAVGGYGVKEKKIFEDWNLWLKFIADKKYPVHNSYYGFWYRRNEHSELSASVNTNKKRAMEIIHDTCKTIKGTVEAKEYPDYNYNWNYIRDDFKFKSDFKEEDNGKINILMIIPWMTTGGADKFNLDLVNKLDRDRFNFTIVTTEPGVNNYRQLFNDGTVIYELPAFLDMKNWPAFINYLMNKRNINFVFSTNSEFGYSTLPYIKANYPEIPIIDYVHMEEWYNRNGGYSRDSSAVESIIDKTLTCNGNTTKIFIDHFKRNPNSVETVYIGVDENKYDPEKYNCEEQRANFGLSKKYVIGFICRISEQKRPLLLLEIIKKLKENRNDFEFLIAGDGNLLEKMKSKANSMGLKENIKFIGNVAETEPVYSASDLTINCSIKEGLALTSYESLSMGVPVISSDVGGQKELINDEVGIIVPLHQDEEDIREFKYSNEEIMEYVNGINKILDNLDEYKANCRKRILDGFTINQMVVRMNDIIKEIYNNPSEKVIENGRGLSNNKSICKELITRYILSAEEKYLWECQEYNRYFGIVRYNYKFELFKEKMWRSSVYRGFVRILQKIGIMKALKRMMGDY